MIVKMIVRVIGTVKVKVRVIKDQDGIFMENLKESKLNKFSSLTSAREEERRINIETNKMVFE